MPPAVNNNAVNKNETVECRRQGAFPEQQAALNNNKRAKLSSSAEEETTIPSGSSRTPSPISEHLFPSSMFCRLLLEENHSNVLPQSLFNINKGGNYDGNLGKLQALLTANGLRTSMLMSPRPAVSVYKDSLCCNIDEDNNTGKEFLVILFGMHPRQVELEKFYTETVKPLRCLRLFCLRIREACAQVLITTKSNNNSSRLAKLLDEHENLCSALVGHSATVTEEWREAAAGCTERVAQLCQSAVAADPRWRREQLQHEYERIALYNSTLSNAYLSVFVNVHSDIVIKDVYFKRSHVPKFERITIYLYDSNIDEYKPPNRFTFLPSLHTALTCSTTGGPEQIVKDMVATFWKQLLRRGYFATSEITAAVEPDLRRYFLSGLCIYATIPLQLNAHFTPVFPLSFYFYGKAGAGKSSLVRNFGPAVNAAIEKHADPEILVRSVKQNLNKRLDILQLELQLRPNNNDMSVMSIIQSRRMTMGQSKPGLVVVALEEMSSNVRGSDPNQLETAQLISQRFAGRKGEYKQCAAVMPRNSDKRGISRDATIIPLFTSNYQLDDPCREALQKLVMFQNLKCIEMTAISGRDRIDFANQYIHLCIKDRFDDFSEIKKCEINLDIPIGEGDTRPLVRHIRMLAFYVCALLNEEEEFVRTNCSDEVIIKVSIVQKGSHCSISALGKDPIKLRVGTMENLLPLTPQVVDPRVQAAVSILRKQNELKGDSNLDLDELSVILDFWLARTLAPAVIVSNDEQKIEKIIAAVGRLNNVHSLTGIDAGKYKMMKSLYDQSGTPNLRDDILKFGRGATVAVELRCDSVDAQLCIREIIEDQPSMTAFSSEKSALYKTGLLFGVYVNGEITPEVQSRASLII